MRVLNPSGILPPPLPTGAVAAPEYGRLLAVSGDEVLLTTSQALAGQDTDKIRDVDVKDLAGGAIGSPLG